MSETTATTSAAATTATGRPIPKPIEFKNLPEQSAIDAAEKAARLTSPRNSRGRGRGGRGGNRMLAGGRGGGIAGKQDLRVFNSPSAATAGINLSPEQLLKRSSRFGVPLSSLAKKLEEESKAEQRAKKFGTASTVTATETTTTTAAAAATTTTTPEKTPEKQTPNNGLADEERKRKRAEKFAVTPLTKQQHTEQTASATSTTTANETKAKEPETAAPATETKPAEK